MCEYYANHPECNFLGMHYHIPCICPDVTCLCKGTEIPEKKDYTDRKIERVKLAKQLAKKEGR